jgi:hypothetical protein
MDAETRLSFFEFVGDQWGRDRAGQLMDLLPPVSAAELVTKQDLAVVAADLRTEIAQLRAELTARIADQTRTIVIAVVTLWVSGMALAFTAARLAG